MLVHVGHTLAQLAAVRRYHRKMTDLLEKVTRNRLFKFFDARAEHKIVVELATLAEVVGNEEKHFALILINKQGCEGKSFSLRREKYEKILTLRPVDGTEAFP